MPQPLVGDRGRALDTTFAPPLRSASVVLDPARRIVLMTLAAIPAVATAAPATLAGQLQAVAERRIFFGHQSVGKNLLDGVEELAREAGVPLRVQEGGALGGPGVAHAYLGENQRPSSKIEAFERAVDGDAAGAEIAFFKFCYVDVDASTDAQALFRRYQGALEALRERHPRIAWVHVTVPLTVTQAGVKASLKALLGKAPWGERENMRREAFNALLREAYGGKEPLFDLARVESTRDDGSAQTFERDGRRHPALVPEYTDDGEHLNARGRRRAARALVEVLASIPVTRP